MEMKELLDGLSSNLGIDSLAIIGGEAAIDIDGMPVLITEAEEDALLVSGLVGDPPPEGCAEFCNLMLFLRHGALHPRAQSRVRLLHAHEALFQGVAGSGILRPGACRVCRYARRLAGVARVIPPSGRRRGGNEAERNRDPLFAQRLHRGLTSRRRARNVVQCSVVRPVATMKRMSWRNQK